MTDERMIGRFDKVTVSTDGPDVLMQLPKNPCRAHWTDFAQIQHGLAVAIRRCQDWEKANKSNGGKH